MKNLSTKLSESGRFIVIDGLHLDRNIFDALAAWAEHRALSVQDAIQIAACSVLDRGEAPLASRSVEAPL